MATLTLKQVPDELLDRLREVAREQRRSVNQHTIFLLERALVSQRPSFLEALNSFYLAEGLPDESTEDAMADLRTREFGREVDL